MQVLGDIRVIYGLPTSPFNILTLFILFLSFLHVLILLFATGC